MWFLTNETSLVAQSVENPPAKQETWVRSLGGEDPLEKEMATHSSIPAWAIPWTEEPVGLWSRGSQESNRTKPPPPHQWNNFYAFFFQKCFICLFIVCTVQRVESGTLTREGTCVPCIARQSLNHWTTRKVSRQLLCALPSLAFVVALQQRGWSFRIQCQIARAFHQRFSTVVPSSGRKME